MLFQLLDLANKLKERHISPLLKRLMNVIFVTAISSLVFKVFYFNYELIDVTDYKAYYFFFANGDFIVPFIVFFCVWTATYYSALLIFKVGNFRVHKTWRNRVITFSLSEVLEKYRPAPGKFDLTSRKDLDSDAFVKDLFKSILKSLNTVDSEKLRTSILRFQFELEGDFVLLFRSLVSIACFIATVPHFGWLLFLIATGAVLFYMFLLFLMYQLVEILPVLLAKSIVELEEAINIYGVVVQDTHEAITINIDQPMS